MTEKKGRVYPKKGTRKLWMQFYDAEGVRWDKSTDTDNEEEAMAILRALESQIRAQVRAGADKGPLTFRRFAEETWLPLRVANSTYKNDASRLPHIYPFIGDKLIDAIEFEDLRAALVDFRVRMGKGEIAARTIRHIFDVTKWVLFEAVRYKVRTTNPWLFKKGELPAKRDKSPEWRSGARYDERDVAMLISDGRLIEWHTVLWAILAFTGSRINEISPRRWRDIDLSMKPLAQFNVFSGWKVKQGIEGPTKTHVSRFVPVHPTLSKILADWKLRGFFELFGRHPEPEDFIIPRPTDVARRLNSNRTLEALKTDLRTLGLRDRDQHSFRRGLITMLENAEPEPGEWTVFRLFTHATPTDMLAAYGKKKWKRLCKEMLKVNIHIKGDRIVQLAWKSEEEEQPEVTLHQFSGGDTMPYRIRKTATGTTLEDVSHGRRFLRQGRYSRATDPEKRSNYRRLIMGEEGLEPSATAPSGVSEAHNTPESLAVGATGARTPHDASNVCSARATDGGEGSDGGAE